MANKIKIIDGVEIEIYGFRHNMWIRGRNVFKNRTDSDKYANVNDDFALNKITSIRINVDDSGSDDTYDVYLGAGYITLESPHIIYNPCLLFEGKELYKYVDKIIELDYILDEDDNENDKNFRLEDIGNVMNKIIKIVTEQNSMINILKENQLYNLLQNFNKSLITVENLTQQRTLNSNNEKELLEKLDAEREENNKLSDKLRISDQKLEVLLSERDGYKVAIMEKITEAIYNIKY